MTQNKLDSAYKDLCDVIKEEMVERLPKKHVKPSNSCENKRRKVGKPWWSEELTDTWNDMCDYEKQWRKCKALAEKSRFKRLFLDKRKHFDIQVRRAKRLYWYKVQSDLLDNANTNQSEFWKSIGKVGISTNKNIPMEVVLDDGSISYDTEVVLDKWKTCFSELYNHHTNTNDSSNNVRIDEYVENGPLFNDDITLFEIQKAVREAKAHKATGLDDIPSEVFKMTLYLSYIFFLTNVLKLEKSQQTGAKVLSIPFRNPVPQIQGTHFYTEV